MNCLQLHQVISYLARFLVGDPIFPDSISWNWGGPLNTLSLVPMYTHVKFDSAIIHLVRGAFIPLTCLFLSDIVFIKLNTSPRAPVIPAALKLDLNVECP